MLIFKIQINKILCDCKPGDCIRKISKIALFSLLLGWTYLALSTQWKKENKDF